MKRFVTGVIFLAVVVIAACFLVGSSGPDYIFLVTLDTTRADSIDYSLDNNQWTPNLARLASQGCYFEHAFSLIPITLPSHASMFYSLPPHRLGVLNNGQLARVPFPSLANLLKDNGYVTGAVVSLGVLKTDFGLHHGFVRYHDGFPPYRWTITAEEVNRKVFDLVRETIKNKGGERAFFWLHYSDPHEPYFPPHLGGDFKIQVNGKEVFTAPCSQWPVVDIAFTVNPGENRAIFDTVILPGLSGFPGYSLQYIKYRDFGVESLDNRGVAALNESESAESSLGVETGVKSGSIVVSIPKQWTNKTTAGGISYYSPELRSEIMIVNSDKQPLTVKLKFHYSLQVDDATRRALYREEVKYMDYQLGLLFRFLEQEGIDDESVFIIMGDHGEDLGEYRNHFGHIHFLNKSAVRVPLIIAGKGIEKKGKRMEVVSNLNIAPTILDIAGLQPAEHMQGTSLLKPIPSQKLLIETYSPEAYFDAFSLIDYPYQVIFYPGQREDNLEFYDLSNDAQGIKKIPIPTAQTRPMINNGVNRKRKEKIEHQEKVRAQLIHSILKISRILTATKGKISNRRVSERHQEILKSLGYF